MLRDIRDEVTSRRRPNEAEDSYSKSSRKSRFPWIMAMMKISDSDVR